MKWAILRNIENPESRAGTRRRASCSGILYRRCLVCDGLLNREESWHHAQAACCLTKRTNIEAHEKTEIIEKTPM